MSGGSKAVLAVALLASGCQSTPAPSASPIRILVVRRGDDGLTLGFTEALLAALRSSKRIVLVEATDGSHDMIYQIMNHVAPRHANGVFTGFDYTTGLLLKTESQAAIFTGACEQNAVPVCAADAVRDLEVFLESRAR